MSRAGFIVGFLKSYTSEVLLKTVKVHEHFFKYMYMYCPKSGTGNVSI